MKPELERLEKRKASSDIEDDPHRQFIGHLCSWCNGTEDESKRWMTHGALVRHALEVHLREGTQWPKTALYPPAKGDLGDNDVTDVLPSQLLWSEFNLPAFMSYLDGRQGIQELKNLAGVSPRVNYDTQDHRRLPFLLEADGKIAYGLRNEALFDIPGLPRRISTNCEHWRLEAFFRSCPDVTFMDIHSRMLGPRLEPSTLTNRRKRYRAIDESAQGRLKGFVMISVVERTPLTIPLLMSMDSLSPRQKANGTTWDVLSNGIIAQPAPTNLKPGERWDPIPFQVKFPYQMRGRLLKVEQALAKAKALALSRGVHWTNLGAEDLRSVGLGGKLGSEATNERTDCYTKYNGKNYKVSELRQLLRDRGLCDSGGTKTALIDRLEQFDQLLDRVDRFERGDASNPKEEDTTNTNVVSDEEEETGDETGDETEVGEESGEKDTGSELVTGNENEHYGGRVTDDLVSIAGEQEEARSFGGDHEAGDKPESDEEGLDSYSVMHNWRDLSLTEELEEATRT
jgi:hypothetical protein